MKIKHARLYVSRREKPGLTPYETGVRTISHALKEDDPQARAMAAQAMAGKLRCRRCLLVPVPGSNGHTTRNHALCAAIQLRRPEAVVLDLLQGVPRESQCQRDRDNRHRFTAGQIRVTAKPVAVPRSYEKAVLCLVDNVCCTGATLEACRRATAKVLNNEIHGLVYARTKQGKANEPETVPHRGGH